MKQKSYEIDMTTGSLWGKVLLFAFPLALSSVLQLLFNAADIVVVGRFAGDEALAAVGSTGSLVNLLINLFLGFSIGASVLVSRYYAAHDRRSVFSTVHSAITLSLLSGLFLAVAGNVLARRILLAMGSPEDVIDLSVLYIRIYFLGMPVIMFYNFGSAILRAVGDTRRPLYYLTAAGVVNVLLNLLFVIVFHMSVAGVALATILSQCLSSGLVLRALMTADSTIRLDLRKLHLDRDRTIEIVRTGLPAGIQGCVFSLSNVLIQSSVNSFGSVVMAGNTAGQNLEGFIYVMMNSFHQAAVSFTSQNLGGGKYSRINKVLFVTLTYVALTGLVFGIAGWAAGPVLLKLYTDNPEVIRYGVLRLAYIAGFYCLCGMMDVLCGSMRGLGFSFIPMVTSILGACAFRIIWIFTVFRWYPSLEVLYVSYPISWGLTMAAHMVCFLFVRRRFPKDDVS